MMRIRRRLASDQGVTLAEVSVTALLVGLVLATLAGIYLSTVTAQQSVSAATGAANDGQLAARSIDAAVRNGSSYEITPGADGGQLLVVRSAGADAVIDWHCAAWYYSPLEGGSIRTTIQADGTAIPVPTTATLATWTLLAQGVDAPGDIAFTEDAGNDRLLLTEFTTTTDELDATTIRFTSALSPAAEEETETCS